MTENKHAILKAYVLTMGIDAIIFFGLVNIFHLEQYMVYIAIGLCIGSMFVSDRLIKFFEIQKVKSVE